MNPSLVAISGAHSGATFALEGETSLGRDESNKIQVSDLLASRKHCVISKDADQYLITDLDSLNGTLVNGIPVRKRALQHGDRIDIGDSIFLFVVTDQPAESQAVHVNDSVVAKPTTRLRVEDTVYLHPERLMGSPARIATGLNTLLRISEISASLRVMKEFAERLLHIVFSAVPAERGAMLIGSHAQEYEQAYAMTHDGLPLAHSVLSRGIITQVIEDRIGILSNDVVDDSQETTALLAVPLILAGKVVGVLYLDTSNPRSRFDEDHLHLMNAVATIAASAIENIKHIDLLETENRRLHAEMDHSMIGESPVMYDLYQQMAKVAPIDSTVLIRGESGTGKELVAQALHRNSARAGKSFVVVNCSTLSETLLESELFGYEKAAFTGALAQKKGKLETANGGTVFFDEIGEIPLPLQSKLLRVLQEREFDRVGGTHPVHIDVRFVAATNRDLESAVKSGHFRQDLFFRLNVVTLHLPPLRDRREDIPLLATYFIAKHGKKVKRHVSGISSEARTCLLRYDWPGNVRELENAIERAVALGSSETVMVEDLPESVLDAAHEESIVTTRYHDALTEAKKKIVLLALEEANGSYKEAANRLGIHPNNIHRLMRNLRIMRKRR